VGLFRDRCGLNDNREVAANRYGRIAASNLNWSGLAARKRD
jgi:hypothetical protein